MEDTKEITLPISGIKVVLRNYTTRNDDAIAEKKLYEGVVADLEAGSSERMKMPLANIMASESAYVPLLVKSVDGNASNIEEHLGALRSQDYEAVEEAVKEIVEEHSPKAKAGKTA